MDIGDRDLCCRDKEIIPTLELKEICLKLGKLAGSRHSCTVNHKRRKHFTIAVAGLDVQHKID